MKGLLCIILVSKCLHAGPVLEARGLPRECGTLAHCAGAEPLCVKIKHQKNGTVNHYFALDKCQLQLLKCQPGYVEAAPVPMKFCQGDQLSKNESTTKGINKSTRHGITSGIKLGRSNIEKIKAKRKSGRSLKKPGKKGFGATHTKKKLKNKPKPIKRSRINVRLRKPSKTGKSSKRKPLVMIKLEPNFLNHIKQKFKSNKKRGRHVPGSLAAPLDYGALFNNPNDETRQGYTIDINTNDPGNGAEENGEANQGDVEGNEGDGGVNEGDGEANEGDPGVNEEGGADEGDGGINEGDGGDNEGDGKADEGDGEVNEGDGGENEGDGEVNEGDGEGNEANGKPDEGDGEVNEEDGGANEGDGGVNEDDEGRGVANEENTNVFWKGDNDGGNNADNVEGVGESDENANDGNVDNETGNNEVNLNDVIARVKKFTNPGLWKSISNGFRGVSVKFNLAVNSG